MNAADASSLYDIPLVLRDEGLVAFRRDSQTLYYRIADPAVLPVLATLSEIYCPQLTGSSRPQPKQGDPS